MYPSLLMNSRQNACVSPKGFYFSQLGGVPFHHLVKLIIVLSESIYHILVVAFLNSSYENIFQLKVCSAQTRNLLLFKFFIVLVVHCGICKISYNISNISYFNSLPPSFSFISLSPHSWNCFNRFHFSIYIHVYTVFALYSPSYMLSPHPSPLTATTPPNKTCSAILFSDFVKEKK
jgi:hypothetical protein